MTVRLQIIKYEYEFDGIEWVPIGDAPTSPAYLLNIRKDQYLMQNTLAYHPDIEYEIGQDAVKFLHENNMPAKLVSETVSTRNTPGVIY